MFLEPYRLLSPVFLILGCYLQLRQFRSNLVLDLADHYLLLCNHLLLISVIIGGWIMQVVYYSVLGTHIYFALIISRYSKHNQSNDSLFFIVLLNLCLIAYLLVNVFTQKSNLFGVGQMISGVEYKGVGVSLDGWNCTYTEFSILSLVWMGLEVYSVIIGTKIMKRQAEIDHKWKKYFINRKIIPTILFLTIAFTYNLYGYVQSNSPVECMYYWVGDTFLKKIFIHVIKILIYLGPAITTLYFYYTTLPLFRRQTPVNSLQQELLI